MRPIPTSLEVSLEVSLKISAWTSALLGLMFGLLMWGGEHNRALNLLAFICPTALYVWSWVSSGLSLLALASLSLALVSTRSPARSSTHSPTQLPSSAPPQERESNQAQKIRGVTVRLIGLSVLCWSMAWILTPPWGLYERLGIKRSGGEISVRSDRATEPPHLHLMSWNVQRMGELEVYREPESLERSVACIAESIRALDELHQRPLDVLAFQEASNRGMRALAAQLSLDCQFIPYHKTQRSNAGGLGICARRESVWRINYARKVKLDGGGDWRALFTEFGLRDRPHVIFNLINLHFLPHNVTPYALSASFKSLFKSPAQLITLLKTLADTSAIQERQARGVLRLIEGYQDPTLILGDFNAPPRVGAHSLFQQSWTDLWWSHGVTAGATRYFAGFIPMRIDYIYSHPERFRPIEARTLRRGQRCSDHLPVSAHLTLLK